LGKNRSFSIPLLAFIAAVFICAIFLISERWRSLSLANTRPVSLPETSVPLKPALKEVADTIGPNQTITDALLRHDFSNREIYEMVQTVHPVYNLARVKANQPFWIYYTPEGKFNDFRYIVDDERYLTVFRDAQDRYVPVLKNFPYDTRVEGVMGNIDGSLISSILDSGEQEILALELANIFGSDIDFYTDLQKGDSFRFLVEKKYLDGKFKKYGSILAAGLVKQNRQFMGYRFEDEAGKPAYYAPDGTALERSFFKSPLKFGARVSSRFSGKRLHPILKIVRPHLGIDYVAPAGTPVQAVGPGTVIAAGDSGAGGKMVKLRHPGYFETMYLHLSHILVKQGAYIAKGDLIGLVGATGLATGPHLDFRITYHGKFINPSKVVFPPAAPVRAASFARFSALRNTLISRLEQVGQQAEMRQK
jgi:murein DD-endopeptidase MepM/ murein hydrolase activator NlpD